jgi:hypothetical protein
VWTGVRTVHCVKKAQHSTVAVFGDNCSKYWDCETYVNASLGKPLSVSEQLHEHFCGTINFMQMAQFRRSIVTYPEMYMWDPVFISQLEYPLMVCIGSLSRLRQNVHIILQNRQWLFD